MAFPFLAQPQAFEAITITPVRTADPRGMQLRVLPNGELIAHAVLVIDLINYAYDLPSNPSPRLNSPPDWIYRDRYDIEAKASPNAVTTTSPDGEIQLRVKQMFRRLLAARFGLVMRVDRRRTPAYALTVSSSGLRLQRSTITAKNCILGTSYRDASLRGDSAPGDCHTFVIGFGHPLNANAVSMDDLAHYIENWTDRPVGDLTKRLGLFVMHTEGWRPMRLPPPPPNGNGHVDFSSLPTIFSVLSGLGLELHPQDLLLPFYTIEQIEHPRR